jgi:hypothetical protein
MKNKKINLAQVWKQFEDVLAPRLGMPLIDRVVYSHLLRHSRVEGKVRLHFSVMWLAHNIGVTGRPVRDAVRRLVQQGVLRLVEPTATWFRAVWSAIGGKESARRATMCAGCAVRGA